MICRGVGRLLSPDKKPPEPPEPSATCPACHGLGEEPSQDGLELLRLLTWRLLDDRAKEQGERP